MRSASSHRKKRTTTKRTGRHRTPSRVHRTIKIIGVAAPAVALIGAFVAYQAQPQRPDPVASTVAGYHLQTLPRGGVVADGSGMAIATQSASGNRAARAAEAVRRPRRRSRGRPPKRVSAPAQQRREVALPRRPAGRPDRHAVSVAVRQRLGEPEVGRSEGHRERQLPAGRCPVPGRERLLEGGSRWRCLVCGRRVRGQPRVRREWRRRPDRLDAAQLGRAQLEHHHRQPLRRT